MRWWSPNLPIYHEDRLGTESITVPNKGKILRVCKSAETSMTASLVRSLWCLLKSMNRVKSNSSTISKFHHCLSKVLDEEVDQEVQSAAAPKNTVSNFTNCNILRVSFMPFNWCRSLRRRRKRTRACVETGDAYQQPRVMPSVSML